MKRKVLFYRDFRCFSGGHLKVWDYFNHVKASADFTPQIHFSAESVWEPSNPWINERAQALTSWLPANADILFLAGMDWEMLKGRGLDVSSKPIINFIQNIRHVNPSDTRYPYLRNKAIRICYNTDVFESLKEAGANGPIFNIPIGLDLNPVREKALSNIRDTDVLIAGLKDPQMAGRVESVLRGRKLSVKALTSMLGRSSFIDHMCHSKVTVFLPMEEEGFFIPPLEGMAAGTIVICPDKPGVTQEYKNNFNCFRPRHDIDSIISALEKALSMDEARKNKMLANGRSTSLAHELSAERAQFLNILKEIDQIW